MLGIAVAASLLLALVNTGLVLAWSNYSFSSTDESTIVTLTNQARASNGLWSLLSDSTLHSIAQQRAKYIYDHQCLSHYTCPAGSSPAYITALKNAGYCYSAAGENYGYNNYSDSQTTSWQFNWWMNSSAHRANILSTLYTRIGVGAFKGDGRWGNSSDTTAYPVHIFVQIFAHPCSSATPTPKPTATATPKPTATATPRPTATATPRPTPTPTPRPTGTPKPTPTGATQPTPTPSEPPGSTPTPSPGDTSSPGAAPTDGAVPGGTGNPVGPFDKHQDLSTSEPFLPLPTPSPEPTPTGTPLPTLDPGSAGPNGLQVVDPLPWQGLLDTIVGGVAGTYFGN